MVKDGGCRMADGGWRTQDAGAGGTAVIGINSALSRIFFGQLCVSVGGDIATTGAPLWSTNILYNFFLFPVPLLMQSWAGLLINCA